MKRLIAALLGVFALVYATGPKAAPIEAYAHLPLVIDMAISGDGATLAYASVQADNARVVVVQLDGTVLQQIDLGDVKVRSVEWAGPDHVLILTSSTSAVQHFTFVQELFQAVSLNIRTGQAAQLFSRVRGGIASYANVLGGTPIYGLWDRTPVVFVPALPTSGMFKFDVVRINLENGITQAHQQGSENTSGFLIDSSGGVLANSTYDQETGRWVLSVRPTANASWRTAYETTALLDPPDIEGFSADGASVIVGIWDGDKQAWTYSPFSLATGARGDVIEEMTDAGLVRDPQRHVIGYTRTDDFRSYTFFNRTFADTWKRVVDTFPGAQATLLSFTPDFSKLVVRVDGSGYPGNYLIFDAASGRFRQVGRDYPEIAATEINEVRSISYHAADGTEIPAYLTLPRGRDAGRLPLVVMPHGGPHARDRAGFDWLAQAIAAQGYAVLQPNFRGSDGYGAAFAQLGYGQWGRKMQTDLSDGIAFLAQRGIADPARVCIVGASYGGYAALAGATLQRDVYRCAVDMEGVSDLRAFLDWKVQTHGRRSEELRSWYRYLGAERNDDPALRAISPINAVHAGTPPVLIIHGRDDTTVPFEQSASMARALQAAGRPVELIELQHEDHWLSRDATRLQALRATVTFLQQHNPAN